jgi:hypothetical protein
MEVQTIPVGVGVSGPGGNKKLYKKQNAIMQSPREQAENTLEQPYTIRTPLHTPLLLIIV